MKLLNQTIIYLSMALIFILSVWGITFYYKMMDEVYDSLDDGLANYKMLIIRKTHDDVDILHKHTFEESNYQLKPVAEQIALQAREVYKDTSMYQETERDFEPVRLLTTYFQADDNQYYELKVIQSMVEEDDLIRSLSYALLLLFLIVVVSMFFINKLILQKIWKPFYELQRELRRFKLGSSSRFLAPETRVQEFASLNLAIQDLLDDNMQVYDKQKSFIDNAAHELQTPLAISRNKIELLMERSQEDGTMMDQLYEILQQLERMSKLNKTLLLLTKIENKQYINTELIDFHALWKQIGEDFAEIIEYRELVFSIHSEQNCQQTINPDLAHMLLTNLLKNAIVHNIPRGGRIEVHMTAQEFSITNTGKAQALAGEHIFSRFYKDSENSNSTGLGLSIVQSIVQLAAAQIKYTYAGEGQHRFTISFSS